VNKTEIENLEDYWNETRKQHERAGMWQGLGFLSVLVDVPLSIHFLPTSLAVFVTTVAALAGLMTSWIGVKLEHEHEETFDQIRRLYAGAGGDVATLTRDGRP